MNPAPPGRHTDLAHLTRAVHAEVEYLMRALEGRPTVDAEKVVDARGHFQQGFELVGQALGRSGSGT